MTLPGRLFFLTGAFFIFLAVSVTQAEAVTEPIVSYVAERAGSFLWTYRTADGREAILYRSQQRPSNFFWNSNGSTVLFVDGRKVLQANFEADGLRIISLAATPARYGPIEALWTDRVSGHIRLATMAKVAPKDVLHHGGGIQYRTGAGRTVPGLSQPDWGLPYIVSLLDLNPADSKWSLLSQTGTKSAAGDTPGLSVIDAQRDQAGIAIADLLASYTCASGQCRADVEPGLATAVSKAAGSAFTPDDLSLWQPMGITKTIIFRTIMGDIAHMTTPVLMVEQKNEAPKLLVKSDNRQIGIAPLGHLLLIEDEFTGGHPILIDLDSSKLLWSDTTATHAVWVPGDVKVIPHQFWHGKPSD